MTRYKFECYATLKEARARCAKLEAGKYRWPTFCGIYRAHRGYVVQITEVR